MKTTTKTTSEIALRPIISISQPISNWYAVYTRSRSEKKFHNALINNRYQSFLPLVKERRQWSDRLKTVEAPLLPGYVFVNIMNKQISEIYRFPWMVNFVYKDGRPAIIRQEEIDALSNTLKKGYKIYATSSIQRGRQHKN